jgi:hypothetical protein
VHICLVLVYCDLVIQTISIPEKVWAERYVESKNPPGHTIGMIAASDKTPLMIGLGNKEMHPLLLSIANIDAGVRMKAT